MGDEKVTFDDVVNKTEPDFKWLDISSEIWRKYVFPDGKVVTITDPVALSLSKKMGGPPATGGGSHRIVDSDGRSHYIPRGWLQLTWRSCPFYEF